MPENEHKTDDCARRLAKGQIQLGIVLLAGSIIVTALFARQLFESHPFWSERYGYTVSMPGASIVIVTAIAGAFSLIVGVSELRKLK